jgi:predicted DNA-binding transcriptional regulator AlpA
MSTSTTLPTDADRLLREDQAAEYLNLAPRTLQDRRISGGGPPYVKISHRCVRYRLSDLKKWVEEHITRRS